MLVKDMSSFLRTMKRDGRKAVVRVKDEGRDVFGNGRTVGETLADVPFTKAHMRTCRGDRLAEVRCRVGHVRFCSDPHSKDAAAEDVGVLVVESRFDGRSLYLCVICPDAVLADRRAMFVWAVRAAQAYCDRECAEAKRREGAEGHGEAARKGPRRSRRCS